MVMLRKQNSIPTGSAGGQLGGTYPNPDVRGIRETGSPTELAIGAIADTEILKRVGSSIVGVSSEKSLILAGTDYNATYGVHRTRSIAGTGGHRFSFRVPPDFSTLVALSLIGIPIGNMIDQDIDFYSEYGGPGENFQQHSEQNLSSVYSASQDVISLFNIASVFSALSANDDCGLFVDHKGIGTTIHYTGILFRYN